MGLIRLTVSYLVYKYITACCLDALTNGVRFCRLMRLEFLAVAFGCSEPVWVKRKTTVSKKKGQSKWVSASVLSVKKYRKSWRSFFLRNVNVYFEKFILVAICVASMILNGRWKSGLLGKHPPTVTNILTEIQRIHRKGCFVFCLRSGAFGCNDEKKVLRFGDW